VFTSQTAEDLEDTESLGLMYKAMKGAIMLNDTSIFEILLREENVMDVVGALE
jgi:protein phosphatase-4 regulatory subunit 3